MYRVEVRFTVDTETEAQLDEVLKGILYPHEIDDVQVSEVLNDEWEEV